MYILLRSGRCYESNNIAASVWASCGVLNPAHPLRVICFITDQLSQSTVCLNSLKPEVHLNNILIFSFDLAEIALCLRCKYQSVSINEGNNLELPLGSRETY